MFKQKKYLDNQPLDDAIRNYDEALKAAGIGGPLEGERVPDHRFVWPCLRL